MPQSEMPYVDIPSSKRASLGLYSTAHASVEVGACMIADMRCNIILLFLCVCVCVCCQFIEGRRGCVLCKNGLDKFGYRDVLLLRHT